jgi:hypothetical protein
LGGGETEPSDASERRSFLRQRAKGKKTKGPGTGVADTSRLLEEVASEANLATALLKPKFNSNRAVSVNWKY